jgi:hypothetical protein
MLSTQRSREESPLTPLKKERRELKVPLFKGDLGGSESLLLTQER